MLLVGLLTGFSSAVTGLGGHLALEPTMVWALGFSKGKAHGTALRFAFFASLMALLGALLTKAIGCMTLTGSIALFFGANIGSFVMMRLTPAPNNFRLRRLFQTVGIGIALGAILQLASRSSFTVGYGFQGSPPLVLFGFGLATGAISRIMSLPGGMLLIPALYFFGGYHALHAALLALGMTLLASLLPSIFYAKHGLVDRHYGDVATVGGMAGAFAGGAILGRLGGGMQGDKIVLTLSLAAAMFLCGRELARLLYAPPAAETGSATDAAPPQA